MAANCKNNRSSTEAIRKLNLIRFSAQANDLNLSAKRGTSDYQHKRKGNHHSQRNIIFPDRIDIGADTAP